MRCWSTCSIDLVGDRLNRIPAGTSLAVFGTFRPEPRDGHERMRLGLDEVRGNDAPRPPWLLGGALIERFERVESEEIV